MALKDLVNATAMAPNGPEGSPSLVGGGNNPTFSTNDDQGFLPAPSSIKRMKEGAESGAYIGRNPDRLAAAFPAKLLNLDGYDPLHLYTDFMNAKADSPAWAGASAVATEYGTIDSEGTLNHMRFSGAPDLILHQPKGLANAFVPDMTLGNDISSAQANFLVTGADAMTIDQLNNKKSYPGQTGGTCISKGQNPASVVESSLGDWMSPGFGSWYGTPTS